MKTLAIIPARSGSVGIPDKNIRLFCGVPLVVRTIRTASAAEAVGRVIVSTDSTRYAELCRGAGAEVVMRPPGLSTSTATSESALLHTLEELSAAGEAMPELLVFLQCTSPFTRAEDIDGLVDAVRAAGADTGLTGVRSHRFFWKAGQGGDFTGINHDKAFRLRRQDRESEFMENGAVYVMRTEGFLRHKHRFFGKTVLHEVPSWQALEIDSPEDWPVAEAVFRQFGSGGARGRSLPAQPKLVVFDFDGVFTDNRVLVDEDGKESVFCDRGDGLALGWLRESGLRGLILSKEKNKVVEARARKVGLSVAHGIDGKRAFLDDWCHQEGIAPEDVIYMGNDLNDLECFDFVGCAVAPADAVPEVRFAADLVLQACGGRGAVRELIAMLLSSLGGVKPLS